MQIDDVTYERIMDTTPVEDLDATWRVSSFKASKKWCAYAQLCGQREGVRVGFWVGMLATALVNMTSVLFDLDWGWLGVGAPGVISALYFIKSIKMIARQKVYMYGKEDE